MLQFYNYKLIVIRHDCLNTGTEFKLIKSKRIRGIKMNDDVFIGGQPGLGRNENEDVST